MLPILDSHVIRSERIILPSHRVKKGIIINLLNNVSFNNLDRLKKLNLANPF